MKSVLSEYLVEVKRYVEYLTRRLGKTVQPSYSEMSRSNLLLTLLQRRVTSFVADGFSVGVYYLFAAVLAWQLGGLPAATLALMRGTAWAFALCFAAITVVSWRYLFIIPIAFSIVITLCLTAAAWLSTKT
jgi:hypothetical protein